MFKIFRNRKVGFVPFCWMLLMTTIVVIVSFCHFPLEADWRFCLPLEGFHHLPMMVAGIAFVLSFMLLCRVLCHGDQIIKPRLLAVSIAITVLQIVMMYGYYVHTDWDVQQVTSVAKAMADGGDVMEFRDYFRWNPNNLFLSRIVAAVFFLTGPMWGLKVTLFPLLVLQCIGACLTALMLTQTAMHIWHRKDCAIMAYGLYLMLVWMSPWWSIPYTDIWGLMFSVALFWLATTLPFKRMWLKLMMIGALTAVGYYIRPQTIFVPLSLLLVYGGAKTVSDRFCCVPTVAKNLQGNGMQGLHKHRSQVTGHRSQVTMAALVLAGLASGIIIVNISMIGCPLHLHTSKALGPSHYMMLGANYQSIGIYSAEDVDFSRSYPKKSERRKAELQETWKRYRALEAKGTLIQWGRKNLLNFSDGTFYWGREGSFYKEVPQRSGIVAKATRSLFHRNQEGNYNAWSAVVTSLWFGILFFSIFAGWPISSRPDKRQCVARFPRADNKQSNNQAIMQSVMLAVIMLIIFHTLCEARARYLFCFTPFFVLLAVEGLRKLTQFDNTHIGR